MNDSSNPSWGIAIFAAREDLATLQKTLAAAIAAARSATVIDVLVNGNRELAEQTAAFARREYPAGVLPDVEIRVWFIRLGDKAHAFNQYVHIIWPQTRVAFFVDGYVRVEPNALALLDTALEHDADRLAASATPATGRTAASLRAYMLHHGGLHGNLYALRHKTMETLRAMRFELPLGLYRTDSTLGASLFFNLDPARHAWEPHRRVHVHPDASWHVDEKTPWKLSDVSGQLKRIVRQGQGMLENLAVRDLYWVQKRSPQALPRTATELVMAWVQTHPRELKRLRIRHPLLVGLALRKLKAARDWRHAESPPELLQG